jgi:predicted SAM-dependent methyltransferase
MSVKINAGCGADIRPGWINCDIQPFAGIDFVADIRKPGWYRGDTAEMIVLQKVLEYIPRSSTLDVLKNIHAILRKEGVLEIRTTDLAAVTKAMYLNQVSREMGLNCEMVISLLYGKQQNKYDVKFAGFTSDFLQGLLVGVGFSITNAVSEDMDVIITAQKK